MIELLIVLGALLVAFWIASLIWAYRTWRYFNREHAEIEARTRRHDYEMSKRDKA